MTWKKIIKNSELVPFPPGVGGESSFLDDLQETFVQSPKNRNRRFPLASDQITHVHEENQKFIDWPHLIDDHKLGISQLDGLDLDHPNLIKLLHSRMNF